MENNTPIIIGIIFALLAIIYLIIFFKVPIYIRRISNNLELIKTMMEQTQTKKTTNQTNPTD